MLGKRFFRSSDQRVRAPTVAQGYVSTRLSGGDFEKWLPKIKLPNVNHSGRQHTIRNAAERMLFFAFADPLFEKIKSLLRRLYGSPYDYFLSNNRSTTCLMLSVFEFDMGTWLGVQTF